MKVFSAALLLLSAVFAEAKKNPHGFDSAFLKAMTQGAKKSPFLKDVTNHERKQFWKKLLNKAVPASQAGNLRSSERTSERKLENNNGNYNYNQYNGGNNGNQNQNQQNYYSNNNNNANNANYNNNGQNANGDDADADAYNYYNGNYNYGGNNVNYNYAGQNQGEYDEAYEAYQYEEDEYYGVDWVNLGFDMKQYSLKYTGCSAVKTFDSTKAAYGYDNVLSTKRFALFRLCPTSNCNKYSVNGCGRNYGEYVLEMDSFLEGVVEFNRQRYWHYCHFCRRCNGLESYGERMSELGEEQMEYYEEMQAEAEAYYESQQEQYQQENENYANENAANYNYYNSYGNYENQNGQNSYYGNQQNNQNNQNANYNNYNNNDDGNNGNNNNNNNGGRKVRKLMVPNLKSKAERKLYNNYNYNQNSQQAYYQQKKQQQYQDGEIDYDEYQEYLQNMNENMYNAYYWDDSVYGEWDEDWSETWLAFNWQVLPYCSESELEACEDADEMCEDYDENFEEDADAMGGFTACTQIDDGLYIGPHCNSDGFTITLGVYSDEYCDTYVGDEISLYDVLGYDIDDEFDFFPQECVTCEEGGEEREFAYFMEANEDFDNYEEWLDTRWQEYIEMAEEMYQENQGEEQSQYYKTQQTYYQAQNYQEGNQQGYYYQNGNAYQNGGGAYYYGEDNQYARYGGEYYQNQQMAEAYGNYGASMLNQGMNFYYNRGQAGDWITNEMYDADAWKEEQQEDYGEYYWYRQSQQTFAKSGISDVCGALYTYAAKCNKHLTTNSNYYSGENAFQYSYGSTNQEANEETVCNFIDNLQTQKYDEKGDIVLSSSQLSNGAYSIDFTGTNWRDPDQVKAQAQKTGVTAGQAAALALTMAACLVMLTWACCLHSTLARKNIPWRPKRGKLTDPTDIDRQNSGIVMGRSRSGMSGKAAPLI